MKRILSLATVVALMTVMLIVMAAPVVAAPEATYSCVATGEGGTTVVLFGVSKEQAEEFKSTFKEQGFRVKCVKG